MSSPLAAVCLRSADPRLKKGHSSRHWPCQHRRGQDRHRRWQCQRSFAVSAQGAAPFSRCNFRRCLLLNARQMRWPVSGRSSTRESSRPRPAASSGRSRRERKQLQAAGTGKSRAASRDTRLLSRKCLCVGARRLARRRRFVSGQQARTTSGNAVRILCSFPDWRSRVRTAGSLHGPTRKTESSPQKRSPRSTWKASSGPSFPRATRAWASSKRARGCSGCAGRSRLPEYARSS